MSKPDVFGSWHLFFRYFTVDPIYFKTQDCFPCTARHHKTVLIHACSVPCVLKFSEMLSGTSCSVWLKPPDKCACLTTEIPRMKRFKFTPEIKSNCCLALCQWSFSRFRWKKQKDKGFNVVTQSFRDCAWQNGSTFTSEKDWPRCIYSWPKLSGSFDYIIVIESLG